MSVDLPADVWSHGRECFLTPSVTSGLLLGFGGFGVSGLVVSGVFANVDAKFFDGPWSESG